MHIRSIIYKKIEILTSLNILDIFTSRMSLPEPAVVDLHGKHLSAIAVLSTAHADMRVQVGGGLREGLREVLGVENSVMDGLAIVLVQYNANPVLTGAVQPQYLVLTLSPHVTFRVDATVFHIRDHHSAMDGAMILDQTADGGLKWVPLLIVERYKSPNGMMITAWFGEKSSPSRIDIAI